MTARFNKWNTSELKAESAPGFFDASKPPVKKILTYDPRKMWTILGLVFDKELTAFHGNMLYHVVWALVVPFALCMFLGTLDGFQPIVDGVPSPGRKWAILFEHKMRTSSVEFRGLIGYVLGGFVARAFSMWYSRRKNYAAFCGTTRNLILQTATATPLCGPAGSLSAAQVQQVRSDLGRWAVLAHELGVLKARGEMDSGAAQAYLEGAALLERGEWDAMVAGDRHTTVLWWVLMAAQRMNEAGAVGHAQYRACSEAVGAMRAQANDLMSSLDRDLPCTS